MKKLSLVYHLILFFILMRQPTDLFSQNIGIGTNPTTRAKLEVQGVAGSGNTNAIFGGEATGISFQRNLPAIGFNQYRDNGTGNGKYMANGFAAIQYFNPSTGYLYFDMFPNGGANTPTSAGTRAFSISNTGNVAIRTDPTFASLFTVKAGNFNGAAAFGGTSYSSFFNYGVDEHTYIRPGKSGGTVFLNDVSGNLVLGGGSTMVGINSANPTYTLEIAQINNKGLLLVDPVSNFNNWEYRVDYFSASPESALRLFYNGAGTGIFSPTGGYVGNPSDNRVKMNVRNLPEVLDRIMQVDPVVYEMKYHNDNHEKTFGFIAQDVKPLFPSLVKVRQVTVDSVNRIPDLHALDYSGFSVIAIKALQEQHEQIKALQKENDQLMNRLGKLESLLASKN